MTAAHLHPDFRHVLAFSDRERILFLHESRWIEYEASRQALDTLQNLLHMPTRSRMPNLLLVADGFNGKTSVLDRFVELCGRGYVNADSEPVKPVVVAQSIGSKEKDLYVAILEKFHAPYRASDPTVKLRYQVLHQCRTCHVRMLVIDEFHELFTGTPRAQREMMGVLKLLANELKIPIVGAGTRDAVRVLHMNDQFASRFDTLTLPRWTLGKGFQRLLAGFEQVLPLRQASELHRPELATLVHSLSGGRIGDVHQLLMAAAEVAIRGGGERIDAQVLEGFRTWTRPSTGVRELIR